MNRFVKLGLAAALMIGGSTAVLAQASVDAGAAGSAGTNLQVKPGAAAGAGANAGASGSAAAGASVDAMTTGSIANQGSLVSEIEAGTAVDLSAFATSDADVNCVMVSSLQGDANSDAQAAATASAANTSFRTSLTSDASILTKIQTECGINDLQAAQVVWVKTEADGSYTIYLDDAA